MIVFVKNPSNYLKEEKKYRYINSLEVTFQKQITNN